MGGQKNSKDGNSSAESVHSSEDETEPEYTVEKVVDKRLSKGKVSYINVKIDRKAGICSLIKKMSLKCLCVCLFRSNISLNGKDIAIQVCR